MPITYSIILFLMTFILLYVGYDCVKLRRRTKLLDEIVKELKDIIVFFWMNVRML